MTELASPRLLPRHLDLSRLFGGCIDVSHWNGDVDWQQVAKNASIVFIKATQGHIFVDPKFVEYLIGAKRAGMMVVPYHFIDLSAPAEQAQHFLETIAPTGLKAVMLDWEMINGQQDRAPVKAVEQIADAVGSTLGRTPLMYHGLYDVSSAKINSLPWHVPKYGPEPVNVPFLFWQNTRQATIPGIHGLVDHDYFNGSYAELVSWFHDGTLPARS